MIFFLCFKQNKNQPREALVTTFLSLYSSKQIVVPFDFRVRLQMEGERFQSLTKQKQYLNRFDKIKKDLVKLLRSRKIHSRELTCYVLLEEEEKNGFFVACGRLIIKFNSSELE